METETIGEVVVSPWGGIGWAIPRGLELTRRGRWSAARAALALAWDLFTLPLAKGGGQ
jgi:hypothetical protein